MTLKKFREITKFLPDDIIIICSADDGYIGWSPIPSNVIEFGRFLVINVGDDDAFDGSIRKAGFDYNGKFVGWGWPIDKDYKKAVEE